MQTNELKNAVATPHHAVVNVGEGGVADDLTLSKVNQCCRHIHTRIYTRAYIYVDRERNRERETVGPHSGP